MTAAPLLAVRDLRVTYPGGIEAVRGVSFDLRPGECLVLVGESGCGKTSLLRAILGLLPPAATVTGSAGFAGTELIGAGEAALRKIRGREIGLVAQDPFDALDPLQTVATHVGEAWRAHGERAPVAAIAERLAALSVADAAERLGRYPHEWSGGMLQRAVIAAADAHRPRLLLADEPTSAIDADRADATLRVLRGTGAALILVSHDLALVARHADRIAVCYAGRIVEIGTATDVTAGAHHPYTAALLASRPHRHGPPALPLANAGPIPSGIPGCAFQPRCPRRIASCATHDPPLVNGVACPVPAAASAAANAIAMGDRPTPEPPRLGSRPPPGDIVVAGMELAKTYGHGARRVTALVRADIALHRGEIVGIGGPSGSGKSTLLRLLTGIEPPTAGRVTASPSRDADRPPFAMAIFQDASGSLDPRWPIWRSVAEPLVPRGTGHAERRARALAALSEVGLFHVDPEARPAELSVGQCQRVAIARALLAAPEFLAADEPLSALDTPVAAAIVPAFAALAERGTGIVVVSHDRTLLDALCDRVLNIRDGVLLAGDL